MGLEFLPEEKIAQRVFKINSLKIPFDIEMLVKKYATVIYKNIPIIGIDGVSLNLKMPGKKPTVIVNNNISTKRQTFTLAHELGHVIIPWHIGTIVDDIYNQSYKDYQYSILEQEANRFAAELLMPSDWVLVKYIKLKKNLSELQSLIVDKTGVSDQAGAIKMISLLPKDISYCAVENGKVLHSGSTNRTNAFPHQIGSNFNKNLYPYIDNHFIYSSGTIEYHWWKLSSKITLSTNHNDKRTWREILDNIIEDIAPEGDDKKFKSSINGIVAHANGKIKQEKDYSIDTVVSAVIYRLRREDMKDFTSHRDFEIFVTRKVESMFNK